MTKRQPKRLSTLSKYKEIAKQFHEEEPLYECKNCFRETIHGKETVKMGIICGNLLKQICYQCGQQITLIEEE